ncbi:MAG: hypothetical protein ACK4FJ_16935 [Ferrovibrio sp.]|uniref:hypothetical protein n=1 Tax=Ferrovibrio sp. TaxID=1917215 RepID=UPI00391A570E
MAKPSVKSVAAALLLSAVVSAATPARALDAVIDQAAIAKLAEQLTKMQQQIDALTAIMNATRQQANAIGKMGQISIPMLNLQRVASRLRQDSECLMPNFDKLMPGVDMDDVSWGSICHASNGYRTTMWLDPKKMKGQSFDKQDEMRRAVEARRINIAVDAAAKGNGQADMAIRGGEDMNKAASDLETAVLAAKESNEWLATIAQGQVVIARAHIQQTQILAQLLKVQSTYMALTALPPQSVLAAEEE